MRAVAIAAVRSIHLPPVPEDKRAAKDRRDRKKKMYLLRKCFIPHPHPEPPLEGEGIEGRVRGESERYNPIKRGMVRSR